MTSLAAVLAEAPPDRTALISDGRRPVTYGRLWTDARRYAGELRARGVRPGDRVAISLPNTPAFPAAYYGVLALGAVAVPLHPLLRPPEIAHQLADSGAVEYVTADFAVASEPIAELVDRADDDPALVLYTSGTSGRPKGALLTCGNVRSNIDTTRVSPFAVAPADVLLLCLPLAHTFGQICGMGTFFRAGATVVLAERFAPATALDLLVRHGCTVFMGVPTMLMGLVDAAADDPRRPPLDRVYSGGASLPVAVLERFEATFGCPVYEGYGLTETSPVVAYNQPGSPRRPGSVGFPVRGVEIRLAPPDGEILIRGPGVFAGYLNQPEATAEVLVDGWFHSGDLGTMDADGYLTLLARKKEVVLRGGYNVYPREVEDVVAQHPSVAEVAVIGVAHPRFGEEVCAVVRTHRPVSAEEIIAYGKQRLAAYKYPRIVGFVDSFPLGLTGKVLKGDLIARLGSGPDGLRDNLQ